jgi:hypothetical protein
MKCHNRYGPAAFSAAATATATATATDYRFPALPPGTCGSNTGSGSGSGSNSGSGGGSGSVFRGPSPDYRFEFANARSIRCATEAGSYRALTSNRRWVAVAGCSGSGLVAVAVD